jgi:hypothetical protein
MNKPNPFVPVIYSSIGLLLMSVAFALTCFKAASVLTASWCVNLRMRPGVDGGQYGAMIPADIDKLFRSVPISEEKALPARAIWQLFDLWSYQGIKRQLDQMVKDGLICRKIVPGTRANQRNVYYRQS